MLYFAFFYYAGSFYNRVALQSEYEAAPEANL